ncbi:MAG: DEAD/DEAH box helicase [Parcubacteria group bacterium]|nr:DEAD/DEAH box helicase [Parcubacteria group bacterium]
MTLLIIGLTPSLLEKPVLWFAKNKDRILRMRRIPSWWNTHTLLLEEEDSQKLSVLLRRLNELGYRKTPAARASAPMLRRGEFFHLGATLAIFPINEKMPWSVEFSGDCIETIRPQTFVEHDVAPVQLTDRLTSLKEGDYVVHADHGIGIFCGIIQRRGTDYFRIAYAPARKGGVADMLRVPTAQQKKLSPYLGFRVPAVHRLGTPLWLRTKKRTERDIVAFAKEILASWEQRVMHRRAPYLPHLFEEKAWEEFAYTETASQQRALGEIFKDMEREESMDRLIVGDVGFGKTELALRAAIRAMLNGRQVALLCPTTVLADQHAALFSRRTAALPVNIRRFTRMESKREIAQTKNGLSRGTVDMLIGTHRLLHSADFRNLGLLIIDEEQRFGVAQKELFKKRYPAVDVLTLTATPIPRTLSMALSSVMATSALTEAPFGKMTPETTVASFSPELVREAIMRELKRGGQVYYLANRIRAIARTLDWLDALLPGIPKRVLHGRLPEHAIIKTMRDFRNGAFPLLISTTIIENGLDISNANTLIVADAGRLGLAQSHQLRGRVGRGAQKSYAYFLYNPKTQTEDGRRRLAVLAQTQFLGAGMRIAERDLEIRGAGNLLGKDQSGVANKIGWNLYYQMLSRALEEKRQQVPDVR